MNQEQRLLSQDEAAMEVALDLAVVRLCAESGLIAPPQGYDEADLAELRRVRRLIEDLGLDQSAVELVVRMRRRLLTLQAQVQRIETELRLARRTPSPALWVDAEWVDVP
jgi:hypothetical protein